MMWLITIAIFLGAVVAVMFAFWFFSQREQFLAALRKPGQQRMEARIPKRVGLELSGPDEPLIYEITFTEKVSCRGARVVTKRKADSQGVGLSLCLVEALDQLWTKTPIFYATRSALSSARATESTRFMVGAVGIEN